MVYRHYFPWRRGLSLCPLLCDEASEDIRSPGGGRSLGEEVLSEPRRSIRERERKEREEKRYDMTPPATTPLTPLYYDFDDALSRWTFAALLALPFLSVVSAPYGRFFTSNWGPAVPGRIGWMIQESVSPIALMYFYLNCREDACVFAFSTKGGGGGGSRNFAKNGGSMVVLTWFIAHYAHRAIVWPLRRTIGKTNVPVVGALFPTDAALALRFRKAEQFSHTPSRRSRASNSLTMDTTSAR